MNRVLNGGEQAWRQERYDYSSVKKLRKTPIGFCYRAVLDSIGSSSNSYTQAGSEWLVACVLPVTQLRHGLFSCP